MSGTGRRSGPATGDPCKEGTLTRSSRGRATSVLAPAIRAQRQLFAPSVERARRHRAPCPTACSRATPGARLRSTAPSWPASCSASRPARWAGLAGPARPQGVGLDRDRVAKTLDAAVAAFHGACQPGAHARRCGAGPQDRRRRAQAPGPGGAGHPRRRAGRRSGPAPAIRQERTPAAHGARRRAGPGGAAARRRRAHKKKRPRHTGRGRRAGPGGARPGLRAIKRPQSAQGDAARRFADAWEKAYPKKAVAYLRNELDDRARRLRENIERLFAPGA